MPDPFNTQEYLKWLQQNQPVPTFSYAVGQNPYNYGVPQRDPNIHYQVGVPQYRPLGNGYGFEYVGVNPPEGYWLTQPPDPYRVSASAFAPSLPTLPQGGAVNPLVAAHLAAQPVLPTPTLPILSQARGVSPLGEGYLSAPSVLPNANQGGAVKQKPGMGLGTSGSVAPTTTTPPTRPPTPKPTTTTTKTNTAATNGGIAGNTNNPQNDLMQLRIDFSRRMIDKNVGSGFTDQFIAIHKVDPITFYSKAFLNDPRAAAFQMPGPEGDAARQYVYFKAAEAAEKDARFLPGAIDRWQQLHGNTPIPDEQWQKWWGMSQNGYYTDQQWNPYGVS
jgi:hypothetical protein